MKTSPRTPLAAAALAAVLALSPGALAQGKPGRAAEAKAAEAKGAAEAKAAADAKGARATQAAALKAQGDEAMTQLRYGDALDAYARSYEIEPAPALLYNKGRTLQALGRFPEALAELRRFAAEAPPELRAKVPLLDGLIQEIAGRVATLALTSNVDGARVHVRDVLVGTTPFKEPLLLNAGAATIQIEAEGYFPVTKQVSLPAAATLTIDVPLVSKATTGLVVVHASEKGATLAVDGKHVGVTPIELSLPAGTHKLLLAHPDRADLDTSVLVKAGESTSLDLALPSKSIFKRPIFWVGVGVVTAGIVAAVVVSQIEKPADRGSIEPGQVASPLVKAPAALRFGF